ncbi:PREDICTED: uncharacterized protein LOC109333905 [Lupinus angustifolius]|uniref:uncharacterized protein LOC109333905 n=1 Tax=Lupinus angustifolius TaxID=3871 RepID=UPI00092FA52B|nr:PREDICTED: uncharacterized protein LOC109333905 [Lupinus angustifolius]
MVSFKKRCDNSLFIHTSSDFQLYVLVYVDDIIVTGSSPSIVSKVIKDLSTTFALKQLGKLDYFLGIEVKHLSDGTLLMSQTKYIRDLVARANMDTTKSMPLPMARNRKLSQEGNDIFEDTTFYRSIVGALQYATITRPDIAFSVNKVCQFLGKPLQSHWTAVKRILKYLQGTISFGLTIRKAHNHTPLALSTFCDADWASDIDDRKSTSGAYILTKPLSNSQFMSLRNQLQVKDYFNMLKEPSSSEGNIREPFSSD